MRLKELHLTIYISILICIMLIRATRLYSGDNDMIWDYAIILYIALGLWWFLCNYRYYTFTRRRLSKYHEDDAIEYFTVVEYDTQRRSNIIKNVFLRIGMDEYYREIDYWLTLPKNVHVDTLHKYMNGKCYVKDLLFDMNRMGDNSSISGDYVYKKDTYNLIRYTMLILIVLGSIMFFNFEGIGF